MAISIYGANNPDLKKFNISPEANIWIYTNIGKFIDLITKRQLWFTRAIQFRKTDPYEGGLTSHDYERLTRILSAKDKDEVRSLWPGIRDFMEGAPGMSLAFFKLLFITKVPIIERNAYTASLSCWHENPSESDAMWALYAHRDAGIAIKSSVARLLSAFSSTDRIMFIAKVNYDSDDSLSAMTSGVCDSLLIKRHAFRHENEVRIISRSLDGYEAPEWTAENRIYNLDQTKIVPPGIHIDCNLHALIEEVVISPLAPTYACEALTNIGRLLIPDIPIRKSTLFSKREDITRESFQPELISIWDHYIRTGHLLDFDELNLTEEELNTRRLQKISTKRNEVKPDTEPSA